MNKSPADIAGLFACLRRQVYNELMSRKIFIFLGLIIALELEGLFYFYILHIKQPVSVVAQNQQTQVLQNKYFTVVVLPDTQNYSSNYPEIFKTQTQWIADNIQKENIVFAVGEGDIVNNFNQEYQWKNAKSALDLIKGKIPEGLLLGNHDMATGRVSPLFEKYFSFSDFKGYSWEGEDYPVGTGYNSYQLFSIEKENFVAIEFSLCPTNDVLTWANKVLQKYSNRKAIITTHGFLDINGSRNVGISKNLQGGCTDAKANTQYIWDNLIYKNKNVFLVLCGHMHSEAMRTDKNEAGNNVYQLLADYQTRSNGGGGLMRLLQFDPISKTIHVKTYSPLSDQFETDANSDFILNY